MEQFRVCKDCDFSGVYAIVNITKQKIYIGSSRNIKNRLKIHKSQIAKGKSLVRKMQEDYNQGDIFVAYVVTPVRVRDERYSRDSDLRYFENLAIEDFGACDPEQGYNKKDTEKSYLREQRNITYASRRLKEYFATYDVGNWNPRYRTRTEEEFVENVLNKEGRF